VVVGLPLDARQDHHRKLARALESSGDANPELLAVHFHGAGETQKAGVHAVVAAERAAETLAFDRAADLYRLALESCESSSAETHDLRVRLADALANAGRASEAADAYGEAGRGASGLRGRDIERRQAEQLFRAGRYTEGRGVLTDVLQQLGIRLPRTSVGLLLWALYWQLRARLAGLRFRPREERDPGQRLVLDTFLTASNCLNLVQPLFSAGFLGREHVLARTVGDLFHFSIAVNGQACATAWQGGPSNDRRALALSRHGLELAERSASPFALAMAWAWHGACHLFAGRPKSAIEHLDRGERIWREQCANVTWELGTVHFMTLFTLLDLGEIREIGRRLPAFVDRAEEIGDTLGTILVNTSGGHVPRLAADDPEGARFVLQSAIEGWGQPGFTGVNLFHLQSLTATDLDAGQVAAARERLLSQWSVLKRSFLLTSRWFRRRLLELRARTAVAAAVVGNESETDTLLRAAEADARALEREDAPWGTALARLTRAGVAATRGHNEEANAHLVQAEMGLDALDMTLRAAAARRRRGEILGGHEGAELVRRADAVMIAQDIRNPARWAALLAPGRWAE
jgi:tetratricopeptide (TPR) repeat protein